MSFFQIPVILVVEDNPDVNTFLVEALAKQYRVVTAFDGEEGLEKALLLRPDLILCNENMPRMGGGKMVRELRRHREFTEVPVVMLTDRADDELQVSIFEESIQGFLIKPFSAEDLLTRIEHLTAEYQQANNRFRLAVEAAPNAMIMVDKTGAITLVNTQTEKLFGYFREELIGEPIDILVPERFRRTHQDHFAKFIACPEVKPMGKGRDLFGQKKDGTEFPIEVGLNPIEITKGLFVLAAVVDITERKQMEQSIREKTALAEHRTAKIRELISKLTKAEQRERSRLAQILHDHLQQLLVAAKIRLSCCLQNNTDPVEENNIREVAGLLKESIRTTRTLSMDLSPPVLREVGFVAALEWLARWMKEKHGFEISIQPGARMEDLSEDRRVVLFQAVKEFLFNASKHAETHHACIRINRQENEFCIVVEDRGKGFNPEILSKSSSEHFGLFHIWERLDLLGCRMNIESAPGKGTQCMIHIPIESTLFCDGSDSEVVALPEKTQGSSGSSEEVKIKLLVVDDHPVLRQCLIFALQDYPEIEVIGEAADGQEAVEKAMDLEPDVIVMDISMPGMTGLEATVKIKASMPNIKIIGLSLHEAEDMAKPMLQAGARAYHCKNDPVDDLIGSILRLHSS